MLRVDILSVLERKRNGASIEAEELRLLIEDYVAGEVADAQMSAFLMAGVIRGFSEAEAIALTEAYVASGDTVDLSDLRGPTVDKHSTGGVGDTTTLIVAPLLAAAGCQVAKLSGRGLGHTGGTLDKLEAIPGFRVDLEPAVFRAQVERIGVAVAAATADLVPADKRIYALRDVTATVADPALIAASVMSKKIAGGAGTIVLDVKTGDGAFMPTLAEAEELARLCVRLGQAHGRRTRALVTDMGQPLGDAVGNALEVAHAIEVLRGHGETRLGELSRELAAIALTTAMDLGPDEARTRVDQILDDGLALERLGEMIEAQGGEPRVVERPWEFLPAAPVQEDWKGMSGTVGRISCRGLGELAGRLGAGRQRPGEAVDPAVGLEVLVRIGDRVTPDEVLARVHARTQDEADWALARLPELVGVEADGASRPEPTPLVLRSL